MAAPTIDRTIGSSAEWALGPHRYMGQTVDVSGSDGSKRSSRPARGSKPTSQPSVPWGVKWGAIIAALIAATASVVIALITQRPSDSGTGPSATSGARSTTESTAASVVISMDTVTYSRGPVDTVIYLTGKLCPVLYHNNAFYAAFARPKDMKPITGSSSDYWYEGPVSVDFSSDVNQIASWRATIAVPDSEKRDLEVEAAVICCVPAAMPGPPTNEPLPAPVVVGSADGPSGGDGAARGFEVVASSAVREVALSK